MITGIYKITNSNKECYIGQSIDIKKRESFYKNLDCKSQPKLYESINNLGWDNHIFEIIIECEESELNTLERYYQEQYNSIKNGLNCRYTETYDKTGKLSIDVISKMKISQTKNRLIKILCPHCNKEYDIANLNRWHLDNCKFKENQTKKRWSPSSETRELMREAGKNREILFKNNHIPWNKGLTKIIDSRIKNYGEKISIARIKKYKNIIT